MTNSSSLDQLQQYLRRDYFPPEKWKLLNSTPFAKRLKIKQMDALSMALDVYELPAGVRLFEENDEATFFAILISGRIDVLKGGTSTESKLVSTVFPGTTFGELSIIDGAPRSASAVSSEESCILVMPKSRFDTLLEKDPALAASILLYMSTLMSERLRRITDALADHLGSINSC